MTNYKHILKSNENLTSIAIEYEVDQEELRLFHNQHCKITELFPKELDVYRLFIYIPYNIYQI